MVPEVLKGKGDLLRRSGVFVGFVLSAIGVGGPLVGACSDDCTISKMCGNQAVSPVEPGRNPDGSAEGGIDVLPPGCDPTAGIKDSAACVADSVGVFVDAAGGDDSNAGTRTSPVKSMVVGLSKLAGKQRLYVCEGTYAEHVKLTSAVSLYGGFGCGSWSYSGVKVKIAPSDAGYALEVRGAASAMVVSDLDITAKDASAAGESSVAIFVSGSTNVTLRRVNAAAGVGKSATDAVTLPSNLNSYGVDIVTVGNEASGAIGAPPRTCMCPLYGASTGGGGGNGGVSTDKDGKPGGAGSASPVALPSTDGFDGSGGEGAAVVPGGSSCRQGKGGASGTARLGGAGAKTSGTIAEDGWKGASGEDGAAGNPGQGGGGGVSVGIVRNGGALEGVPRVVKELQGAAGRAGPRGSGGTSMLLPTAPDGADGTPGLEGVAQDVLVVP